jgi:hypothetical protein
MGPDGLLTRVEAGLDGRDGDQTSLVRAQSFRVMLMQTVMTMLALVFVVKLVVD